METRICKICGIEKPIDQFHKEKRRKDGYKTQCSQCYKHRFQSYISMEESGHRKEDIDGARQVLESLGYILDEPEFPVHRQFNIRYNLK